MTAYSKETDDSVLWKNFRLGDESAYTELAKRHYKSLLHYGKKFTCNIQLAEDALQDLLIHLWLYRKNLNDTPSVKSYLLKSFRHQLLKAIQPLQSETHLTENVEAYSTEFSFEETLIKIEQEEYLKSQIESLVNKLPARQKEVIYLRFFQSLKPNEISEILDINTQSVNNIIQRALSSLRSSTPSPIYYYLYIIPLTQFLL